MELSAEEYRNLVSKSKDGKITSEMINKTPDKLFDVTEYTTTTDDPKVLAKLRKEESKRQEIINIEILDYLREKHKQGLAIFIPGDVHSLKNSKQIISFPTKNSICHKAPMEKRSDGVWICTKCRQPAQRYMRPSLVPSDAYQEYAKNSKPYYNKYRDTYKLMMQHFDFPHPVGFYFIKKTAAEFDFVNIAQGPLDLAIETGWLPDDSMKYIYPDFLGYHVDKEKVGCIITAMDEQLVKLKYKRLGIVI